MKIDLRDSIVVPMRATIGSGPAVIVTVRVPMLGPIAGEATAADARVFAQQLLDAADKAEGK